MTKQLIMHGNSAALVIEKPKQEQAVLSSLSKVNQRHSRVLKRLAE